MRKKRKEIDLSDQQVANRVVALRSLAFHIAKKVNPFSTGTRPDLTTIWTVLDLTQKWYEENRDNYDWNDG